MLGTSQPPLANLRPLRSRGQPKLTKDRGMVIEILLHIPMFADLGAKKLEEVFSAMYLTHFSAGEYICKQNDPGNSFYVMMSGSAYITINSEDAKGGSIEKPIREVHAKDFFGEKALIKADGLRSANVVAIDSAVCLTLQRAQFQKLMGSLTAAFLKHAAMQHVTDGNSGAFVLSRQPHRHRRASLAHYSDLASLTGEKKLAQNLGKTPTQKTQRMTERRIRERSTIIRESVISNSRIELAASRIEKEAPNAVSCRLGTLRGRSGSALGLLRNAAGAVAVNTNRYVNSVYSKLRDRIRFRPALVEKFPSVMMQMVLLGTEEDVASVATTCQDILAKPPHDRTLEELDFLGEMIMRLGYKRKYCQGWEASKLHSMLRRFKFCEFAGNHKVFEEGDDATNVYILLSGKMTVSRIESGGNERQTITLKAGETAGDLAFHGINRRSSTVTTASRCECMVINVADYRQISGGLSIEDKFTYLRSTELFQDWDPYQLYRLAFVLKDVNAAKGSTLVEQGEMSKGLYFIFSGTAGVQCMVSTKNDLQTPGTMATPRAKVVFITNLGANGFLGESGLLQHFSDEDGKDHRGGHHRRKYFREATTARVSSQSIVLLCLQPEHYGRIDPGTVNKMRSLLKLKEQFRKQRSQFVDGTRDQIFDSGTSWLSMKTASDLRHLEGSRQSILQGANDDIESSHLERFSTLSTERSVRGGSNSNHCTTLQRNVGQPKVSQASSSLQAPTTLATASLHGVTTVMPPIKKNRQQSVMKHRTERNSQQMAKELAKMTSALCSQSIDQLLCSDERGPFAVSHSNPEFVNTSRRSCRVRHVPKSLTPFQQRHQRYNPLDNCVTLADHAVKQTQSAISSVKEQRLHLDITCRITSQWLAAKQREAPVVGSSYVQMHEVAKPLQVN